jgi:SEC-C motif-containing protein
VAKLCPCTSGRPYSECCRAFHAGEHEAPTPEALMRSRFAAFARADVEYLWRTLHGEHEDRARPKEDLLAALRATARAHRFMRLAILEARQARVLFHAAVFEKGKDRSFVELSEFALEGGAWRYVSGIARPAAEVQDLPALTIARFLEERN